MAYEQSQTELLVLDQSSIRLPLYVQHPLNNTVLRSPHQWHLVLRGHRGDWKTASSPALGWEVNQPLLAVESLSAGGAFLPEKGAFLVVDSPGVVVSGIKKSYYDNSFILHCTEMLDNDTALKIKPELFRLHSVSRVNLSEDRRLAPVGILPGRCFPLELKGFGIEALSIKGTR